MSTDTQEHGWARRGYVYILPDGHYLIETEQKSHVGPKKHYGSTTNINLATLFMFPRTTIGGMDCIPIKAQEDRLVRLIAKEPPTEDQS